MFITSLSYAQYCDSTPSSNDASGISNVKLMSTDFAGSDVTYLDFTGAAVDVQAGTLVNTMVTFQTGYGYDTHIWIDFGDDGSFTDAGDLVYSGESLAPNPTTLDASFSLDALSALGIHRMRIGTADSGQGTPNPCYSGTYGVTVDLDVNVTAAPACLEPSTLTATSITATDAVLAWTEEGTAALYNVEVVVAGGTPTGTATDTGVVNGFTKTGLAAASDYEFYVQADCTGGDVSTWSGPYAFTTECEPTSVFPWTEDYETTTGTDLPICWSENNNNADGDSWKSYTTYGVGGTRAAGMYTDFNNGNNDDYLILPQFTLTGGERLKYSVRARSAGEPNDYKVVLSTTGKAAADFTVDLQALTTVSSETHAEEIIDLSAYSGNVYIAIHVPSGGLDGWYIYFDNFTVESIPSCSAPTALVAITTSLTEVDLTWAAGNTETAWTYEYGVSPYTQGGGGTSGNVMTTTSLSFSSLTAGETYDLFLQANCGGDGDSVYTQVSWTQPNAGETCAAPIAVGALPYNTTDNTANYGDNYTDSPGATGCGSTNGYLTGDDVVYSYTATFSGSINIALSSIGSNYTGMFVYNDCGDIGTTCANGAVNGFGTADLDYDLAVVSGETYYIVISTWATPQSTAYTLDITELSCPDASAVMVSNVTTTTADLSWTDNGTTASWNIELIESTATATGIATDTATTNAYGATVLMANTTYNFYVQADCGGSLGTWYGPFAFTTPCDAISTFPSATDFTNNTPTGCWSEAGSGEVTDGPTGSTSDWRENRAYLNAAGDTVNSNALNLWQSVDREWLVSPTYTIPSGTPHGLLVQVAVTDYSSSSTPTTTSDTMGSDDEVKLLMTVDNGATWTTLTTWNVGNQPSVSGTDYLADLTAVTGDVKFALWGSDGTTDDLEDYDFHVGVFRIDTMAGLSTDSFETNNFSFKFYPNPVENNLTINSKTEISSIEVFNVLGQTVLKSSPNTNNTKLNMSQLNSGAYFVKVVSGNNAKTIRIIKN